MARENLPEEVVRVLALHGPVQLVVGPPGGQVSVRCAGAPFDDLVFLFVRAGAAVEDRLLGSVRAELWAKHPGGEYTLRLLGRAVAGGPVMAHERRLELLPWLPEGADPRALLAVPFWPERVEYQKGTGVDARRFEGPTPEGLDLPSSRACWSRAAFGGIVHLVVLSLTTTWVWLAWSGSGLRLRPVAWIFASACSLCLLAGSRLLYRAAAFGYWRRGLAERREASVLAEGFLAPRQVRMVAAIALSSSAFLSVALMMWSPRVALVAVGSTLVWVLGPIWWLQLIHGPEPE